MTLQNGDGGAGMSLNKTLKRSGGSGGSVSREGQSRGRVGVRLRVNLSRGTDEVSRGCVKLVLGRG